MLKSNGVAPIDDAVLEKLKKLHPKGQKIDSSILGSLGEAGEGNFQPRISDDPDVNEL